MSDFSEKIKDITAGILGATEKSYERSGSDTSEGKISKSATWVSIVVVIIGLVESFFQSSESPWAGVVIAGCGLVSAVLVALGYAGVRSQVKQAQAKVDVQKLALAGEGVKIEALLTKDAKNVGGNS